MSLHLFGQVVEWGFIALIVICVVFGIAALFFKGWDP